MKRICFIGASTTEGMGDESGVGWPGRLIAPHEGAIVGYNLGVRGHLLAEIRARAACECKARILDYDQGGIVFCSGMNDIARYNGFPRTPMRKALATFEGIIADLKKIAPLILVGPLPVYAPKMPVRSQATGLDLDFRNGDIGEMDAAFKLVSEANSVPYLPIFPALVENEAYTRSLNNNDGLHPGGAGYQLVAELVSGWAPWRALIS